MDRFIQKLNQDYSGVFANLEKVKILGIHSREGQRFLLKAKLRLENHLKLAMAGLPLRDSADSDSQGRVQVHRLLRYQKSEIERFLKQASKYSQRSFLLSISGRQSDQNFAKLLGRFKKNLLLEQKLLSDELRGSAVRSSGEGL